MAPIELISQGMAIVVALSMGRHDATAIKVFHEKGWGGKRENWWFHQTNNLTKFLFVVLLATTAAPDIRAMVFVGIASALWIYLFFDMATGKWGHACSWWYIGQNDDNGNWWRRTFKTFPSRDVGKIKAAILFLIILGFNLTKEFIL